MHHTFNYKHFFLFHFFLKRKLTSLVFQTPLLTKPTMQLHLADEDGYSS